MLRRYTIKFVHDNRTEEVDSYYEPQFQYRGEDLMIYIIGRDCGMLYYASETYISCVTEL